MPTAAPRVAPAAAGIESATKTRVQLHEHTARPGGSAAAKARAASSGTPLLVSALHVRAANRLRLVDDHAPQAGCSGLADDDQLVPLGIGDPPARGVHRIASSAFDRAWP